MRNFRRSESRLVNRIDRSKLTAIKQQITPPASNKAPSERLQLSSKAFFQIQGFLLELLNHKDVPIVLELTTEAWRKSTDFLRRWRVLHCTYRKGGCVELRFQIEVVERLASIKDLKIFEASLRLHRRERERVAPRRLPR